MRPELTEAARAFLRYAADAADGNVDTVPVESLLQASIDASCAVYRLGVLPRLSEEDESAIKDRLERVFVGRAVTARDIVRDLRVMADGG